jgi:hypothetical protein
MQTFNIEIVETSSRKVQIDANSLAEAMDIAGYLYKREEIMLDNSDHVFTAIDCLYEANEADEKNLREFVINKLQQSLEFLSLEDLAKLSFGSVANALIEFKKQK